MIVDGRRIFIAADDRPEIHSPALEWSDAYGVVNVDVTSLGTDDRILPIGPSFGVRWGGIGHVISYAARASRHSIAGPRFASRVKKFVPQLGARSPIGAYVPAPSDPERLFYVATFWHRHAEANGVRKDFLEVATRLSSPRFEGGLVSDVELPEEYAGLRSPRSYAHSDYLERVGSSVLAFNTPAVHRCLGWKLGEFFALGKAIVTLPLERPLPGAPVDGQHFHVVDGSVPSIEDAIERLASDHSYRRGLEMAARDYWSEWLAPAVVMRRILNHADAPQ